MPQIQKTIFFCSLFWSWKPKCVFESNPKNKAFVSCSFLLFPHQQCALLCMFFHLQLLDYAFLQSWPILGLGHTLPILILTLEKLHFLLFIISIS